MAAEFGSQESGATVQNNRHIHTSANRQIAPTSSPRGRKSNHGASQHEDPRAGACAWIRVGQPRWQLGDDNHAIGEAGGQRTLLDAILTRLFA